MSICGPFKWSLILVLQNTSTLRKQPWVQIAHNLYLSFWLTGIIHKNTTMFYWCCNCVVVTLPMITPLTSVA